MLCSLIPKDLHRVVTEYFPKVEAVNLVVQCVFHENVNWSFVKQYIPAKSILMFTQRRFELYSYGNAVGPSVMFLSFSPPLRNFLWENYQYTLVRRLCCRRKTYKDLNLADYEKALRDRINEVLHV